MPTCPLTISGLNVTDALIGITPATSTGSVTIPIYGTQGSGCTLRSGGYRSIIGIRDSITGISRDGNGQLTSATSIIAAIDICKPTEDTVYDGSAANLCATKDRQFIVGVKHEYEYYYKLYTHAVSQLVTVLATPIETPIATKIPDWKNNQTAIDTYKSAAIALNTNVNDIIYVIDQIAQVRRTQNIPFLTDRVNQLDESLERQGQELLRQRELLSRKNQDQMLLMKEMEAYSRQKAKYNNNMLMLYSFLNITALGLLFYVYRS